MTDDNWTLIQDLFHKATQLQGRELESFRQKLEQYPEEVRKEVTNLLQQDQHHEQHEKGIIRELSSISQDLTVPEIEGYDVIDLIAHGGMGSVYSAFDQRLSRTVAIKVLHPYLSSQQKFKQRFMREARAAARIQHENINTIFEVSESESGLIHIASAFCEGVSLSDRIRQGTLTIENILSFMSQLASALVAAHAQGIVHRDLKPENIIIDDDNRLTLVDFGIAKIRDEHQTSTGEIIGTPAYMSPEQFRGEAIDPLTDIWSLGMILYELMEGRTPFDGKSAPEIVYSMLHEPIPYTSDKRETYRSLYDLMQHCLSIDKASRPANAQLVQQQLIKVQSQLQSDNLNDHIPHYQVPVPGSAHKSDHSIATQKNVFVLHLFGAQTSVSSQQADTARTLVQKYRGRLQQHASDPAAARPYISAWFGYPLVDELTLKNGLLCALAWTGLSTPEKPCLRALAQYQQVHEFSGTVQQNQPAIDTVNESSIIFMQNQEMPGLWVSSELLELLPENLISTKTPTPVEQQHDCLPVEPRRTASLHPFSINRSPFTGREAQLSMLNESWEQALEGDYQRVLISGEAGIGKSRLIYEFRNPIAEQPNVHYIELACSPYEQSSTYYPILSYLKQQLANASGSLVEEKLDQRTISEYLHELMVPEPQDHLLMCELLGIPLNAQETALLPGGDLLNRRYQSLLQRILTSRPQGFTTLLIIEDLHWIDPATGLIVERLLQPSSVHATLIVLSCRPEYKPGWLSNVVTSNLYLSKLRQTQTELLLEHLIRQQPDSDQSATMNEKNLAELAIRTGGNPLFIEELAKSVHRDDTSIDSVPHSIQDTLSARVEKLGAAKELAQIAAVIGRNFKLSLLQQCSNSDASDFKQQFRSLVKAEIFFPSADADNWYFKHALIRDAAYQTLLHESRQQLHSAIARSIETNSSGLADSQPSLLALHWEKSLDYTKAIQYWHKTALRNLKLHAITECIEHCHHALELLQYIDNARLADELSLSIYMTLGPAFMTRHGYAHESVYQSYSKALDLCEQTDNTEQLIPALFGLWTFYCVRAQHEEARKISTRMVTISENRKLAEYLCESHMLQGINDYYRGEFMTAQDHFRRGAINYKPEDAQAHILKYGQDPCVVINNYQAWNELLLGNIPQAAEHCQRAIQYARELKHPFTLVYALSFATWFHLQTGKLDNAQELISDAIAICREQKIEVFLGLSLALQALLYFARQQTVLGQQTMQEANEVYLATGAALFIPSFLAAQAEVIMANGEIEQAHELLNQSLALIEQSKEEWCLSQVQALKAMTLTHLNQPEKADACMHKAIATLEKQNALGIKMLLQQKGLQLP
jgi:serine/threonine protein kinase/predicted ATPase